MKIGPFGSALKKEFYTDTGVKVYAQENIFKEDFEIGDYYISEDRYQTLKGCKLEPGDLVISMMGTIGACAIFPDNAEPGIMNSHLLRLQLCDDIYPEYIHQLLRDSQVIRVQIERLSVGSIMSGLSSSVVKKLVFPIPSFEEQKKIANFLVQLDKLITLHQKKLELFKKYKRGLLLQLFPKPGESIPAYRFASFTGPWSEVCFKDILEEFANKTSIENQYDILSSTNTGIEKRKGRVSGESNIGYKIIDIGDLVLSPQNLWLGNININNLQRGIVSPSYKTFKVTGINIDFLEPQLHMKYLMDKYNSSSVQGASVVRRNLDLDLFNQITIPVPSSEEQSFIANAIKDFDCKIFFEEEKLLQLKQYKIGLLQQMLI